jgi:hypothetical protein
MATDESTCATDDNFFVLELHSRLLYAWVVLMRARYRAPEIDFVS